MTPAAKPLSAVIFDLDGVLIDSESVWDEARRQVTREHGGHWTDQATTDMQGMSSPEWSSYLQRELGVELEPEEINRRVVDTLLEHYRHELPLLPGATEAVHRLAARWPLGLASSANRPVIDAVLQRAGLDSSFAATVSGDEVQRGKPAPDVYLAAARKLGVEAETAAAVEDSSNGLRSAAAASMLVIAAPNERYPPDPEALRLAALTIDSLDQLTVAAIEAAATAAR